MRPNLLPVEEALADVTFPISRKDLLDQVEDGSTALVDGRNVALRDLIHEVHDDFFETEDELLAALETAYAGREEHQEVAPVVRADGTPLDERAWNDPAGGGERGASTLARDLDAGP